MPTWRLEREEITDVRVFSGIFLPLLAGWAILGWRAVLTIGLVIAGSMLARWILMRLAIWPARMSVISVSIRSVIVALFLPAQLFDMDLNFTGREALWAIPVTVGIVLSIVTWATSLISTRRYSPVVLTAIFAMLVAGRFVQNDRILQRDHLFRGNLLGERYVYRLSSSADPWLFLPIYKNTEAFQTHSPLDQINEYLNRKTSSPQAMTISRLLTENLPPMEDLVIGGQPAAIGLASVLAIIIGGLLLVYRGLVAFRVPVLMIAILMITMICAPLPVVVSSDESIYRWLACTDPRVGWSAGTTFLNYTLFASTALPTIFFLACQPGIRPYRGMPAMIFAIFFGVLCGLSILYLSLDIGPLVALAIAQLIAPTLDNRFRRHVVAASHPTGIVDSLS